jgi:subtilisin family serine protease
MQALRMRRTALLLIAVVALAASSGGALAQKMSSRGGAQTVNAGKPTISTPPVRGGNGGGYRGGGWHGGWRGPGIVVAAPPGGRFIDGGPPPPSRRSARRNSSGAPPAGERRLVPDEVLIAVGSAVTPAQIDALQRRLRLTRIEQQTFQLAGTTLYRWRIPDRRAVATVVRALERESVVASAQPNYLFTLQQDAAKPAVDDAQYALAKLHLPQAHALAKGDDVRVAVIDSGIDTSSPELAGSIADSFDTLASPMTPHRHGTAIAGLIAAHGKLTGAAPDARILAVRAFNPEGAGAQGTTFNILKGLDWAAAHGARVINMRFAGPGDPALHRSLAAAHIKGIVLVAAAGNAGSKSPPLYPAADSDVIAVSATDASDKLFAPSNRGPHIAIAAPGDQILVALPAGGYEVSSGTSYAAAEVSGIVALMLQREPALTPDRARAILQATAKDLGAKGRDPEFGAGLADAYGAVTAEKAPIASATLPVERASAGQR